MTAHVPRWWAHGRAPSRAPRAAATVGSLTLTALIQTALHDSQKKGQTKKSLICGSLPSSPHVSLPPEIKTEDMGQVTPICSKQAFWRRACKTKQFNGQGSQVSIYLNSSESKQHVFVFNLCAFKLPIVSSCLVSLYSIFLNICFIIKTVSVKRKWSRKRSWRNMRSCVPAWRLLVASLGPPPLHLHIVPSIKPGPCPGCGTYGRTLVGMKTQHTIHGSNTQ